MDATASRRLRAAVREKPAHNPADYVAPTLILLAPLLHFLEHHDYSLWRPESLLLALPLIGVGLLFSLALRGGSHLRRVLLISFVLAVFLNLRGVYGFFEMLVACAIVAWLLREHLTTILTVGFAVLIATTYLFSTHEAEARSEYAAAPTSGAPEALPPIVHLVLDEHIGLEGIPQKTALGREIKAELQAFYADYGFRVHGGAYSQYFKTYDSLSNLFNFTSSATNSRYFPKGTSKEPYVLTENRYFSALAQRGYRFRVYQSHFMSFCDQDGVPYLSCSRYGNTIKAIEGLRMGTAHKSLFIVNSFLQSSSTARHLRRKYRQLREYLGEQGVTLPVWSRRYRVGLLAVPPVLQQMREDIQRGANGTVFFAHLLLPHYPYVFQPDCRVHDKLSNWWARKDDAAVAPLNNSSESREARYERYFLQLRCQQDMLAQILEALRDAGVWDTATVVLHGDHGSRISVYDPLAELADDLSHTDIVDHYSTMFALKAPHVEPGYTRELAPLQNLLVPLVQKTPPVGQHQVYLMGKRYRDMPTWAIDESIWPSL